MITLRQLAIKNTCKKLRTLTSTVRASDTFIKLPKTARTQISSGELQAHQLGRRNENKFQNVDRERSKGFLYHYKIK